LSSKHEESKRETTIYLGCCIKKYYKHHTIMQTDVTAGTEEKQNGSITKFKLCHKHILQKKNNNMLVTAAVPSTCK
jgi:hypothetical protein